MVGSGAQAGCVTDNLTGLIWARDANLAALGDPATDGLRTWQEALDSANDLELCGFTDWRLPNRKELRTLVNYGAADHIGALNALGFINVQAGGYWSSTTSAPRFQLAEAAWTVHMQNGGVAAISKTLANFVWPVRAGQTLNTASVAPADVPETGQTACYDADGRVIEDCTGTGQDGALRAGVAWPSPRFVVGSGAQAGCVTDRLTGLMWVQAPDDVPLVWVDALAHAESLNSLTLCGFSDWRLPNVNELESLVNLGVHNQATELNAVGFSNVQGNPYWSSTLDVTTSGVAWPVSMFDGRLEQHSLNLSHFVWPVRGGL